MGIRDLAAKARDMLRGDTAAVDETVDTMHGRDKFDNITDDRFTQHTSPSETLNERIDDFTGGEGHGHNREPGGI